MLVYLFVAAYAAIHIVSWAQIRYRLPIDLVAIPWAAMAVVALADRLRKRSDDGAPRAFDAADGPVAE